MNLEFVELWVGPLSLGEQRCHIERDWFLYVQRVERLSTCLIDHLQLRDELVEGLHSC